MGLIKFNTRAEFDDYIKTNSGLDNVDDALVSESNGLYNSFVYIVDTNQFYTKGDIKEYGAAGGDIINIKDYALKTDLDTKQDVISDLDDIRSGASLGATSIQNETYNTDKTNTDSRISTLEGKTKLSDFTDDLIRGYKVINHGTVDTSYAITPNVYHIWGEVTSLSLTYDTPIDGFANEYLFQFTSGSTATTLSLPDTVKWANDNVISIESGKTYSISIVNNLALFASFTN